MTKPAPDEFRAAWKALPRADRNLLASTAARGQRGRTNRDAALMLWWAGEQLKRGPWPALWIAGGTTIIIIVLQLAFTGRGVGETLVNLWGTVVPILLLLPFATWFFRRPKLHRSMQLNAGVLTGRTYTEPLAAGETERILGRAGREGWLREPRSGTKTRS